MKRFFALIFLLLPLYTYAANTSSDQTDSIFSTLIASAKTLPIEQRITFISQNLLGKPYVLEPLGEGPQGIYNQEPLYRSDRFDCETYVNTVLALALSDNLNDFQTNIRKINYLNAQVDFVNRFHFTDAEWVPQNLKNGFIKEITKDVAGEQNLALQKTILNRSEWYKHLTADRIRLPNLSARQQNLKLQQLRNEGIGIQNTVASIQYIPLRTLFADGKTNWQIFNKIPNAAIILFIHQDPNLVEKIGTDVNVSHMGLVIWKNGQPYLRAASTLKGVTTDLPLINYLKGYLKNPKLRGIALFQATLPQLS